MTLAEFERLFKRSTASYVTQSQFLKACHTMVPVLLEIAKTGSLMNLTAIDIKTGVQPEWYKKFQKALDELGKV